MSRNLPDVLMRKIVWLSFIFAGVGAPLGSACTGGDIAEFNVTVDASSAVVGDLGWRNHLGMLRVMGFIPQSVSIAVPRSALSGGVYKTEPDFLRVIEHQSKNGLSNLFLRLMANWMNQLGADLGRPDLSGKFFAWILNQPILERSTSDTGQLLAESDTQLLKAFSFLLFPSLRELQFFEEAGQGSQPLLRRLLTLFHSLEWMASEELAANEIVLRALNHGTKGIGVQWATSSGELTWGTPWSVRFGWVEEPETAHQVLVTSRGENTTQGFWWIPSPKGGGLSEARVPSIGDIQMNGEELASLIALPDGFVNRQRRDCRWIEYLLFPFFLEADALPIFRAPEAKVSSLVERNIVAYRTREIPEFFLKEAAIAYGMAAVFGTHREQRGLRVAEYIKEVLKLEAGQNLATIEVALRRFEVPVFLISSDETFPPNTVSVWPMFPQFADRKKLPRRRLKVLAPSQIEGYRVEMNRLGLTPALNLSYLENETGLLTPFDPARN